MTNNHTPVAHSALLALAAVADIDLQQGYQWLPAHRFTEVFHPTVEVELPLFITGIIDQTQLSRLARTLANAYPAQHKVFLTYNGQAMHSIAEPRPKNTENPVGRETNTAKQLHTEEFPLAKLLDEPQASDQPFMSATEGPLTLCVPPLPEGSSFAALQAIVAHLRSPIGCPWDREQTLHSMRHDLLGECAEVLEAIDHEVNGADNSEHIAEELGDLFMAGVLTLQIAIDEGRFQLADAMQSIVTKLIRRHPHVFGDVQVDGVAAVWANWEAIKAQEKADKGQIVNHPLDGVPATLPALEKAREMQSKAQKAKLLDRAALATAWEERLAAFQQQRKTQAVDEADLGQLLWTLVAVAQQAGLNAEDALRSYAVRYKEQCMQSVRQEEMVS